MGRIIKRWIGTGGTVNKSSSDTLGVGIGEGVHLSGVRKTALDSLGIALGEASHLNGIKKFASDVLSIAVAEVSNKAVKFQALLRGDTLGISLGELAQVSGPGTISLQNSSYSVQEGEGLSFNILRGSGDVGIVRITWTAAAPQGSPTPSTGTVTFADRDSAPKVVNITVGSVSATVSGTITLSNPENLSGGSVPSLASPVATLQILSSDLAWTQPADQFLFVGVAYNKNLNDEINPDVLNVDQISGAVPGISLTGTVTSGTPTTPGEYFVQYSINDNSDEADYAAAAAIAVANGERGWGFGEFNNRAAMMAYLLSIDSLATTGGPKYVHTGVADAADQQYSPVPPGEFAKVDLSTTEYLTGGRALITRQFTGEANDNGPLIEIPILNPGPVNFYRVIFKVDPLTYTHNYMSGGDGRKILFLDHFSFATAQIVVTLSRDQGRYINAYIVDGSGARTLMLDHGTGGPGGLRRQLLTGIDTGAKSGPGGATDANNAALWAQRWGPSKEDPDLNGLLPFESVGEFWVGLTIMTDQNYVNPSTGKRGMLKIWQNHKAIGGAWNLPTLNQLLYRDANMTSYPTRRATAWRLVIRPEDATNPLPGPAGIVWDQAIRSPVAMKHPGGFNLPFPGQQIPPGWPPAGTIEDN